jgi:uncharacterized membrane protein YuzA (DUF378 family)
MLSFQILVGVCVVYVLVLFLVAFAAEQRASSGHIGCALGA